MPWRFRPVGDDGPANPDSTEHWIASLDDDVGWIQCYPLADSEEAASWATLGVEPAAGIDYLVGEPACRGRGVGTAMTRAFVDEIVFGRHPSWTQAGAAPQLANEASWRALAGAGFRAAGDLDDPIGPCRVMIADRLTCVKALPVGIRQASPSGRSVAARCRSCATSWPTIRRSTSPRSAGARGCPDASRSG